MVLSVFSLNDGFKIKLATIGAALEALTTGAAGGTTKVTPPEEGALGDDASDGKEKDGGFRIPTNTEGAPLRRGPVKAEIKLLKNIFFKQAQA